MKYCELCGAELTEDMRFCSQCGREVSREDSQPPRDYWAERLQQNEREPGKPDVMDPLPQDYDRPERPRGRIRRLLVVVSVLSGFVVLLVVSLLIMMGLKQEPVQRELYYGRACSAGEMQYTGEGDWVALQSDGRAELYLASAGGVGTWTRQGDQIAVVCEEKMLNGTLQEGILTLHHGDFRFVLSREGIDLPLEAIPAGAPSGAMLTQWTGDYYGWWQVSRAWGQWEDSAGLAWDVCGRIWLEEENQGKLELWDSQCRLGELFCAADIEIGPGLTPAGCLQIKMGRFCDFEMMPGTWVVDPGREPYLSIPNLICFSGSFQEADSGFMYQVFLRPWGTQWKDVKEMVSPLLPAGDRLPPHYRDWYLPLIGSRSAMPESFYTLRENREESK